MKNRLLPMPRSLQSRMMTSVSTLLFVLMGLVSLAVHNGLTRLLLHETRARGIAVAQSIGATTTNALLNYDYVSLNQTAQKAVLEGGIAYVIILDKEGKVAAHSERPDLVGMEVVAEPKAGPSTPRRTPTLQNTVVGTAEDAMRALDVSYPVFVQGSDVQWGSVRIGLDLEPMHAEVRQVRLILLGIGMVGVLFVLVGTWFISRRITRSIEDLVRGTIQVSRGNLDYRIEIDTGDEIATLAEHFNHMTAQVKKQQDEIAIAKGELEILNTTLEEKVAKRTQEFLASEEKYRVLVDNSPDPILISQGGVIRFMNPAFEQMFDYEMSEALRLGTRTEHLFHADDRAEALEYMDRVTREEVVLEAREFRGATRDGNLRIFEMRGMRITYMDESAIELILLDTTEKKKLQDHLLQHEKLRALGELASGVAHDFNNILGIILGRSQVLQQRVEDEEIRRGLRTIERAAFDGGETVRRIQDFARSRTERNFEDTDIVSLLEEVVEITRTRWRDQAELRNVRIDVELNLQPVGNIKANGSELREVYTNLIFNSVDAMPVGGTISIASRMDGEDAVVTFSDNGRGMDPDVRARIFDPFFTTKGTKGLGMGMAVVYGIIERHNGMITVESEPGVGTRFTIRIPSCAADAAVSTEKKTKPPEAPGRVLVVDDEVDILELMSDILDSGGHEVVTASGGQEGLDHLEKGSFEMVFCDLGMRGMSGWEVVSAVRAMDSAIGVVLLTGWGATLSEEKVAEYGIDAVLNKPFEMKKILETVTEVLELARARSPQKSA